MAAGLNESIIKSIMDTNNCTRQQAKIINNKAILAGAKLSDKDMAEFDDCMPSDEEWKDILSGIDKEPLE